MDSLKSEIQELSKEVLEIKKTEKEEKINIRILSNELERLRKKITEAEEERDHIPETIEYFKYWSEEIKNKKNQAIEKAIILGAICLATVFLLGVSSYAAMFAVPIVLLSAFLGFDILKLKKLNECRQISIVKLGKLEKKDMYIGAMKTLANKKEQELTTKINNMNQECHNKELELNRAKEKRQNKEATYCNLTDKIQKLTKERINLSNMLLEEYENSTGEKRMSKSLFTTKNPQ